MSELANTHPRAPRLVARTKLAGASVHLCMHARKHGHSGNFWQARLHVSASPNFLGKVLLFGRIVLWPEPS